MMILLLLPWPLSAQHWQTQLGTAMGRDNNIFESSAYGTAALFSQFHLHLTGSVLTTPRLSLSFDGQAGVQGYAAHGEENRGLCDLTLRLNHRTGARLRLGTLLRYRGKAYFLSSHGYGLPMLETTATVRLTHAWQSSIYARYMQLNYSLGSLYDHAEKEAGLRLIWAASGRIRMAMHGAAALRRYERTAVNWTPENNDQNPWTYASAQQEDRLWRVSCHIEYYHHMLLRLGLAFEKVSSNSMGFNYTQPSIQLTAAREIGPKTMIFLKWAWRGKHYDDPLNPALHLRPDTESEDMNMAVLELTRNLNARTLLSLRWGWYENESPYRNRYYQKTLTTMGMRIRL